MSHNRSSRFKTFHAKQYKDIQLTSHVLVMMLEILLCIAILDLCLMGKLSLLLLMYLGQFYLISGLGISF